MQRLTVIDPPLPNLTQSAVGSTFVCQIGPFRRVCPASNDTADLRVQIPRADAGWRARGQGRTGDRDGAFIQECTLASLRQKAILFFCTSSPKVAHSKHRRIAPERGLCGSAAGLSGSCQEDDSSLLSKRSNRRLSQACPVPTRGDLESRDSNHIADFRDFRA